MTMHNHDEYSEKSSTKSFFSISATQFLTLVENARDGTPPGPGWGVYDYVKCMICGYAWTCVAMVNTKGKECPNCGYFDAESIWLTHSEFKGEGAFLNPVGEDYSIVNKN